MSLHPISGENSEPEPPRRCAHRWRILAGLEDGEAFILELVTPFVLRSEYPKANNVDVPWW